MLEFYFKLYYYAYWIIYPEYVGLRIILRRGFCVIGTICVESTKTLPEVTYFPPHLQKKKEQFFHQNEDNAGLMEECL